MGMLFKLIKQNNNWKLNPLQIFLKPFIIAVYLKALNGNILTGSYVYGAIKMWNIPALSVEIIYLYGNTNNVTLVHVFLYW